MISFSYEKIIPGSYGLFFKKNFFFSKGYLKNRSDRYHWHAMYCCVLELVVSSSNWLNIRSVGLKHTLQGWNFRSFLSCCRLFETRNRKVLLRCPTSLLHFAKLSIRFLFACMLLLNWCLGSVQLCLCSGVGKLWTFVCWLIMLICCCQGAIFAMVWVFAFVSCIGWIVFGVEIWILILESDGLKWFCTYFPLRLCHFFFSPIATWLVL